MIQNILKMICKYFYRALINFGFTNKFNPSCTFSDVETQSYIICSHSVICRVVLSELCLKLHDNWKI